MIPADYRSLRETSREERRAVWLIVFVVLACGFATGWLEDRDDGCAQQQTETR